MSDPLDFTGKVVLVAGGAKGIGRGITQGFLSAGAEVMVCGRSEPAQLPAHDGRSAAFFACDVRAVEQVAACVAATVERIEYDPNRTAFIALIKYEDGEQAYIIAPQRLAVGDTVTASAKADIKPGNAMPFSGMPIGTIVHNIEMKPGKGGQIARAAGTYAQFVGRDGGYAQIRLSSGELRMVRQECMATVGAVSNPDNSNQNLGKAGRNRHLGKRPSVRGVVMNPIDHPHGGGEGRTSGGRHPVTPWGKPTKGKRTRNTNKASQKLIIRSRHAKKKGR